MSVAWAVADTVAVRSSAISAVGTTFLTVMPSMAAPELLVTEMERRLKRCLNTMETAFADGRTPVLTAETKSEEAMPEVWSEATVKLVGTVSAYG